MKKITEEFTVNGKGDKNRVQNRREYRDNYDYIFRRTKDDDDECTKDAQDHEDRS